MVLREAIANAVVHREYDTLFRNDPVNIDVYSDRVEISSPGNLWGGKTLQNLANGVSRCRNTTLMQLLQKTPLIRGDHDGSAVEGQGSGIQFMINRMKELSLAQPDFHPTFDRFRVILYRGGAEIAANQQSAKSRAVCAPTHANRPSTDCISRTRVDQP